MHDVKLHYSPFKKTVRVPVFWITRDQKEIETCSFHQSIATMIAHMFLYRKKFSMGFSEATFYEISGKLAGLSKTLH